MKSLLDRFSFENAQAQELVGHVQAALVDGIAPSEEMCEKTSASLAVLRATYHEIRDKAASMLSSNELPADGVPAIEYYSAVQRSTWQQKSQMINTLMTFLNTKSNDERYDSILAESRSQAAMLLADLQHEDATLPDVSLWAAFNKAVPLDDFDTEEGTAILDVVETTFPRLAVRGLMLHKYYVDQAESSEQHPCENSVDTQSKNKPTTTTDIICGEDSIPVEESSGEAPSVEIDEPEATNSENPTEAVDAPSTEMPTQQFIHPRQQLKPAEPPSKQKLSELLQFNQQVLSYLVDKAGTLAPMKQSAIVSFTTNERFTADMCIQSLQTLENKGFLAAYEYEDEVWYCVTPLYSACLRKESLLSLIKRITKKKRIEKPILEAMQDMPLTLFTPTNDPADVLDETESENEEVSIDKVDRTEPAPSIDTSAYSAEKEPSSDLVIEEEADRSENSTVENSDSAGMATSTTQELEPSVQEETRPVLYMNDIEPEQTRMDAHPLELDVSLDSLSICAHIIHDDIIPSDEQFSEIILKLLQEQNSEHVFAGQYAKLSQALTLAKSVATDKKNQLSCHLYNQLLLAMHTKLDRCEYSGEKLTALFAEPSEDTQAIMLAAYCFAMLTPSQPYDYTLRNTTQRLESDFDSVFPAYGEFKALFHLLNSVWDVSAEGFSASIIDKLSDHAEGMVHQERLKKAASKLLREPNIKTKMHGLPELCSACFGVKSDIYAALEYVANNTVSERELVLDLLASYCEDDKIGNGISEQRIENVIDREWKTATKGKSTSRAPLNYLARKQVLAAFAERLNTLMEWAEYDNDIDENRLPEIKRLRAMLLSEISKVKSSLNKIAVDKLPSIAAWMLISIEEHLSSASEPQWLFADLLTAGGVSLDDNGYPIIDTALNLVTFYEPWRTAIESIIEPRHSVDTIADLIMDSQSEIGDNLRQLVMLGRYLNDESDQYIVTDQQRLEAERSANDRSEEFKNKLELAYTYNRIEEVEKESLLASMNAFQDVFYENGDFACWRRFLAALVKQIENLASKRKRKLRSDLASCVGSLKPGVDSSLLTEAKRLLEEDENFAVTEDYINRFRNGELDLTEELTSVLHDPDSFAEFISDEVFEPLYRECANRTGQAFSKYAFEYSKKHYPQGWTDRHKDDSRKLISNWPVRRNSSTPIQIENLFKGFGFLITGSERVGGMKEEVYRLCIRETDRNMPDYRHPIAKFGTQAASPLYVVVLFGKRMAQELVDIVNNLNLGGMSIVLIDYALDLAYRRQVAEIFHTRTSGQNSFLLIDQVLGLHLALHQDTERLPILLKCTLPYTNYQPFLRDGGPTADEMFCGRVSELSTIIDPNGACVVYGGRQLGKTALLQRAESLSLKPEKKVYAAYCSIYELTTEAEVVHQIMGELNSKPAIRALKLKDCDTIKALCDQFRELINTNAINNMLLLIDEADAFLHAISSAKYEQIRPLVDLKRVTHNRFKFVLAGLHNVCRAKNATADNGLFGQLGQPLCVKPLSPTDALQLISRPLRYLGFQVARFPHLETILTNTNYYPGILQFFGYTLVETLTSQYGKYYRSTNGNPPFTLQKDQLGSIISSADLSASIKKKFRWSLELDDRYFMLARCITMMYHENQDDPNAEQLGFSVDSIMKQTESLDMVCLNSENKVGYINLLDEMVDMGILSCPDPKGKRYRLRRRSFLNYIGADMNALLDEIIECNKEANA